MSTRRARIKAVTSLPPRRKNAEAAKNNNKPKQSIEILEKPAISPRTPIRRLSVTSTQEQNVTPSKRCASDQNGSGKTTPVKRVRTPNLIERTTPVRTAISISPQGVTTTTVSEKSHAPITNHVFASPLRKDSPKRTFISPTVPSPKINRTTDVPKVATPQKKLLTPVAQIINKNNELQISENAISKINHNTKVNKTQDGTALANVNDEAMDGIVPLQPVNTVHKPIDLLKNEIISENAEVLFDPIVPLPSPSKVRPKLKPVPRLGPHRRSSIQGSASESEDESRRNLLASGASRQRHDSHTSQSTQHSLINRDVSRVRNDSVCSSVSQIAQPLNIGSPVKEKQVVKTKRQEARHAARRRRENIKRDNLTMYDLIFYNPTSNPIVPDEDEINLKEANDKEKLENIKKQEVEKINKTECTEANSVNDAAPVPQIKLGPQGELILDEESLVIKQTNNRTVSSVVYEGAWSSSSYKPKRSTRTADWSSAETVRFYRALAAIGTDFSLMAPLFPDRTRKELKFKFKKEEKLNGAQVDMALQAKIPWDALKLQDEFKEERIVAAKLLEEQRQRMLEEKKAERERLKASRELRVRTSRGAKALESSILPDLTSLESNTVTAEDIIERSKRAKTLKRQKSKSVAKKVPIRRIDTLATITPLSELNSTPNITGPVQTEMATLSKITPPSWKNKTPIQHRTPLENRTHVVRTPDIINGIPQIPSNIETGSLVVLTVNDPSSPAKKMLQTYIADGTGKLEPVALPSVLLNSVVGYMKKNTPKSSFSNSPQLTSPNSVTSQDSRTSTPSGIKILPSPTKRHRNNSFTITQL